MTKIQKQVCDIKPGKGMSVAQSNEHLRVAQEGAYMKKIAGTMDPSREHLNFEIQRGGIVKDVNKSISIPRRIKNILKERGIKDPNEGMEAGDPQGRRTIANIILQGSRDTMLKLAFGEQEMNLKHGADNSHLTRNKGIEEWAIDMYHFVANKYGEENIAAFVVHLDETCPHIHCTLLPLTKMNKFSWKQIFAGKSKYEYAERMKRLHDELAKVNAKYGLERGESIAVTGAQHKSYLQWLQEQIAVGKETINEQSTTINNQKQQLYAINATIRQAERKLKGLTTMIQNLETKKAEILKQVAVLEDLYERGEISNERLVQQEEQLKEQLADIEAKITDKQEKLADATTHLQELARQKQSLQTSCDTIQHQIKQDMPTLLQKTIRDIDAILWGEATQQLQKEHKELQNFSQELPTEQRIKLERMMEDSLLEDIAQRGNDIAAVAATLFLGYVEQAMNYAQECGGGGNNPGTGWGRDKDEDEEAYKRRCCIMGRMMMRPVGRKLKR